MRALILNSGMGSRMETLTKEQPKSMTQIHKGESILSRQLKLLYHCGVTEIIMTTGFSNKALEGYCNSLGLPMSYTFVFNPIYDETNYIYSIYLAREYLDDDILMLHGDLVFELSVLKDLLEQKNSYMTVSSTIELPSKDFKAVIKDGLIGKIGIEFFDNAVAAQPLYKINKTDWKIWLDHIKVFCESGQVSCYAEDAFNEVSDKCYIYPLDFGNRLCTEIDTPDDLALVRELLST